jgi:prevent-host-death family protein
MAYTVHQAKTHLSRLLKEAEEGKEVIVMRGDKAVARIVSIEQAVPKRRLAGGFEFLAHPDPHVFDPLTDEQMIEYGFDNPEKDARLSEALAGNETVPEAS